jgi:hypothetical protein
MSTLSDKISSYAIEKGLPFEEAYANPPTTQTGSLASTTTAFTASGTAPVYSTLSPPAGAGSWAFVSATRLRSNAAVWKTSNIDDNDYTAGIWFMHTGNSSSLQQAYQPLAFDTASGTEGFGLRISGSGFSPPSRLAVISGSTTNTFGSTVIAPNTWYFLSVIKESSTNNYKFYINGNLELTITNAGTTNPSNLTFGSISASAGTYYVSNFFYAPSSAVTEADLLSIYNTGMGSGSTDVTILESPATADALQVLPTILTDSNNLAVPAEATGLMTEPTIVISANDNIQVTTSIIVSAEFPENIITNGSKNVNIVVTDILTASTELINNVIITTNRDESFSAAEFVATAELVKPFLAEQPMIATATMPNATVVIPQNYYNLVNSLNPVFYYNFDGTTMQNYGSWNISSYDVDSRILKNEASTGDMSLIGAGKSWKFGGLSGGLEDIQIVPQNEQGYYPQFYNPFAPPTNTNPITDLQKSRSYAIEGWFKPDSPWSGLGIKFGIVDFRYHHAIINLTRREGFGIELDATLPAWSDPIGSGVPGLSRERLHTQYDYIISNDWNHVVLNFSPSYAVDAETGALILTANRQNLQLWINGNLALNRNYLLDYNYITSSRFALQETYDDERLFATFYSTPNPYNENTGDAVGGKRGFWRDFGQATGNQTMFDEFAIYDQPLTNSQIMDHYSFIANQNPNRSIFALALNALAESGSHVVLIESDANVAAAASLANAEIAIPSILAEQNINITALPSTASALNTDVDVYFGWTIDAVSATAYAERPPTYFLNDIYYEYVKTNINPYRYVTFDSADATLDYGTDNDYSVSPTTIGGTVVNPDLGINGKSVKTTGNSYITDGVILNESEWNDSWGTGQNSYHSAFWFQRALDDASTTGLRVLWNLNGYKDNQHVILYQYQGKLHMQFNNGSGTWIQQDTATLDLFDYERHFIVIEFDHTNANNNTVRLYVDTILKMTVSLGAYTGTTTNASSADSGPNNEINNRPRLSVGCLITPFGSTALPAIPANTKLIIDEVYWDKNAITQTQVSNVYNAMPGRTSTNFIASPLTSETTMVNPEISTSSIIFAQPLDSNALIVTPTLALEFSNIYYSDVANASADITEAFFGDSTTIVSDIFVASAILNSAGVLVGIQALPMTANVFMNPPSQIMGLPLTDLSDYIRYLRIESYNNEILHYQEVK